MSEWMQTTIGEVLTLQRGFDITRAAQRAGSIPVVSSSGIGSYHDTSAARGPGVVIGRKGTLGRTFYLPGDYWPHDTTLWVKDFKGNLPRFVYYFFKQLDVMGLDVGSANPTLNRNHVHPIPVLWPSRGQQERIVAVLGALDDKIAVNERISQTAAALALARGQCLLLVSSEEEVVLAEHAEIVKGISYRSADLGAGENALVTLKCVGRDGTFQSAGLKPYFGPYKDSQVVNSGDVVVAQTDLTQRAEVIGRPVRVVPLSPSNRLVVSLDLLVVRPGSALSREVLFAILSTQDFRDHAMSYCNGTTVLHMGARALPEYRFRMPRETAVKAATEVMSPLLDRSDNAKREIQSLGQLRDALLPGLISGAIRVRDAEKVVEDAT